eukprot:8049640-Ditylum_brightwellii.AAC.1
MLELADTTGADKKIPVKQVVGQLRKITVKGFVRDKSCYATQILLPVTMEERQKGWKDVQSHLTVVGRYPSA